MTGVHERVRNVLLCLAFAVCARAERAVSPGDATAPLSARDVVIVGKIDEPIVVDGALTEAAWGNAARFDLNWEIEPGVNVPAPARAVCRVMWDEKNFYVGFVVEDPNPSEIRAHLSDRDAAYRDDFVGFMVDTFNDERRGFEFFVNPVGVQMDLARNDVGTGDNEDGTWDAIWDSAARITPTGWEAEIAIPFAQLRLQRTEGDQTWSFLPFRAYPRSVRHQLTVVTFDKNNNCFFCQAPKIRGFAGVQPGKNVEVDPTLTARRTGTRESFPHGDFDSSSKVDPGVSARWGITPNLSLNGAVNPDFSQVEADVARLAVNNRFALFYPEKRPFFLEGADFFRTPLEAVYTREVADPEWGIKLTGKEGGGAIGAFISRDSITNLLVPGRDFSTLTDIDSKSTDSVFRYRQDVGESSTVGALYTDRRGDGYSNRVLGADAFVRFSPTDFIRAQVIGSRTKYPNELAADLDQPLGTFSGSAEHITYAHDSQAWNAWAWYERYGREFRADQGFIPRVDTAEIGAGVQHNWYGAPEDFWTKFQLWVDGSRIADHEGDLTDQVYGINLSANGPLQSSLNARVAQRKELFAGALYANLDRQNFFFNIRPTGDFTCSLGGEFGEYVDYVNATNVAPRSGRLARFSPGFTWNIGRHLYVQVDNTSESLTVPQGRLYRANLTQARFVWQFNVRTFVRAIFQYAEVSRDLALYRSPADYDSKSRSLFTQLLFSWKLNPQTVFFLGYSDTRLGDVTVDLLQNDRTVFLKVGYAWLM